MKRTAKWLTTVLSLAIVTNSLAVYSAGDAVLPSQTSHPSQIEETASDTVELAPAFPSVEGEEITEWREEGVRHYYLGNGQYQAVVSAGIVTEDTASPMVASPNATAVRDTYISSTNTLTNYGSNQQLYVSDTQTSFFYCNRPALPANANITDARLYFMYKTADYDSTGSKPRMSVGAYPVNFSWSESALTWSQANSHDNLGIGSNCLGTATLYESTSLTKAYLFITEEVRLWYMGNLKTNCGIAIKRRSGSIDYVNIMSRESGSTNSPYFVINYSLYNLPIETGTYYLQSAKNASFFVAPKNISGKNYCQINSYGSSADQQWRIEYLRNGYYSIKNTTENLVLSVETGKQNSSGYLIRETFSGATRQQWKITQTSDGTYKIKPRSSENYSSDWVMCATRSGITGEVVQGIYNHDENFSNEWFIRSLNATPLISFTTKILIDQGNQGKESEIIANYLQAVEAFEVVFGIEFKTPTIEYAPELDVSTQCDTFSNDSAPCTTVCGNVDDCNTVHHKSASRLKSIRSSDAVYTCRLVDYAICGAPNGQHEAVGGVGTIRGKDSTVSTCCSDDTCRTRIQHELTHNLAVQWESESCINDQACVLKITSNAWCDACYEKVIQIIFNGN